MSRDYDTSRLPKPPPGVVVRPLLPLQLTGATAHYFATYVRGTAHGPLPAGTAVWYVHVDDSDDPSPPTDEDFLAAATALPLGNNTLVLSTFRELEGFELHSQSRRAGKPLHTYFVPLALSN